MDLLSQLIIQVGWGWYGRRTLEAFGDVAVCMNWGSFKRGLRAPLKGVGAYEVGVKADPYKNYVVVISISWGSFWWGIFMARALLFGVYVRADSRSCEVQSLLSSKPERTWIPCKEFSRCRNIVPM